MIEQATPRSRHRRPTAVGFAVLVAFLAIVAAACGSSSKSSTTTGGTTAGTNGSSSTIPAATKDDALAAMLPASIKSAGKLEVPTDASYAPNEFFASDGTTIIGMDVDLGHAIGQVLGVNFDFTNVSFDAIIPAIGSRYAVSMSSFTDTKERQQKVDMVDYFTAGTSFYVITGKNSNLTSLANICGAKVAVEKGTTEETDAQGADTSCKKKGKPGVDVQAFTDQNGANLALSSGRVDAAMADSPVAEYAVQQSNGKFALNGQPYGTAPYGIVVAKGSSYSGLANAILGALKDLESSGLYMKILRKWGVQAGGITNFQINGAVS
jgi:polar amino acid transport system substrate-binding protein